MKSIEIEINLEKFCVDEKYLYVEHNFLNLGKFSALKVLLLTCKRKASRRFESALWVIKMRLHRACVKI